MMSIIEILYSTAYLAVGAGFLVSVFFVGTSRAEDAEGDLPEPTNITDSAV